MPDPLERISEMLEAPPADDEAAIREWCKAFDEQVEVLVENGGNNNGETTL